VRPEALPARDPPDSRVGGAKEVLTLSRTKTRRSGGKATVGARASLEQTLARKGGWQMQSRENLARGARWWERSRTPSGRPSKA